MKIALYGGRFDPVHNGHLAVAKEVLKMQAADEVWFSIENQHQWRPIVASAQDRKAMLKLAIVDEPRFRIDETPIRLGGLTETLRVVREIRKRISDEIVFIVGSDQLGSFDKWTHWEELQKEVHFLIVARKGFPLENIPSNASTIPDPTYEPLEDSATRVRDKLAKGESITDLVPKKVEEYIKEHALYV